MTGPGQQPQNAGEILSKHKLRADLPVFTVGMFDRNITVLSQQVRALNLAWALTENHVVGVHGQDDGDPSPIERKRIAVVGAGFAGLTVAAGLLTKHVNADIVIFEKRDVVLPIQHGCDSRWLHPHIYNWPNAGSQAYSAALPVLNWTAGRASDVVFQVLKGWEKASQDNYMPWKEVLKKWEDKTDRPPTISVFCNTRHLRVSIPDPGSVAPRIEWSGEPREITRDPGIPDALGEPGGYSREFDIVVLAFGFGPEKEATISYWRNDNLAQPRLAQAHNTYIVAGAGDAAMADLFRLRISQFRDDRILHELFSGDKNKKLREELGKTAARPNPTFGDISKLWQNSDLKTETEAVLKRLRGRLRKDTTVLLAVPDTDLNRLFKAETNRLSFQNKLLAYLLFRCNAFTPVYAYTPEERRELSRSNGVRKDHVIIRFGPSVGDHVMKVLDRELREIVNNRLLGMKYTPRIAETYSQSADSEWPLGYFDAGFPHFGREYLPSPMQEAATIFCAAVAHRLGINSGIRVTLYRILLRGEFSRLQQCCDYQGQYGDGDSNEAGRVFSIDEGAIGAAVALKTTIKTKAGAANSGIVNDMKVLGLNNESVNNLNSVESVAAIPLIYSNPKTSSATVIGVLYLDSTQKDAFELSLKDLIDMCLESFLRPLEATMNTVAGQIANTEYWNPNPDRLPGGDCDSIDELIHSRSSGSTRSAKAFEKFDLKNPPETNEIEQLNFDFVSFAVV